MRAAETAVRTQFRAGFRYAKAGAILMNLQSSAIEQGELDLFSEAQAPSPASVDPRAKLMSALDALNNRFGRDSVRLSGIAMATNGADIAVWATKQERRSPRYTTRWDYIPTVRI